MRSTLVAAAVTLLVLTGLGSAAGSTPQSQLAARLTPAALTSKPTGVRPGAGGTFRATFWRFNDGWDSARFWLRTRRLTGPVVRAEIHTGAPGKTGPVLMPLCSDSRCVLLGTGFRLFPPGTVDTLRVLGGYVVVHTKRNPRGELRGQIVISP